MPLDTPVPERFQEQFEQAVRDVLGGISQSELEVCRELPPPRQAGGLDLACAPELDALTVTSDPDERTLGVTLYFAETPTGTPSVVPDDVDEPAAAVSGRKAGPSPTYLGELGGGYADLSDAIVGTLAAYCDAPSRAARESFPEEDADLLYTGHFDDSVTFSLYVAYPEHVEAVYGDGRRDLARRYGLPY